MRQPKQSALQMSHDGGRSTLAHGVMEHLTVCKCWSVTAQTGSKTWISPYRISSSAGPFHVQHGKFQFEQIELSDNHCPLIVGCRITFRDKPHGL